MTDVAGHNRPNVRNQDGTWEVQGTLNIDKASGGVLTIDGVDVSAGLEEIANLTGLDSGELGVLNGVTAGTVTASKAVVVGSTKMVDEMGMQTQVLTAWNATGGTLSKGDIVSFVGVHTTGQPKIVKADANTTNLKAQGAVQADILTGAAGQVILRGLSPATLNTDSFSAIDDPVYLSETAGAVATAAESETDEINQIVGYVVAKSATVGQIFYNFDKMKAIGNSELQAGVASVNAAIPDATQSTLAVAAEAGDAIAVTLTLKNAAGTTLTGLRGVKCWLSDHASSGAIGTDDTITVTATTGTIIAEETDDLRFDTITDANGVLVLSVAHAGNATPHYLVVQFPNGELKISAAIDLA